MCINYLLSVHRKLTNCVTSSIALYIKTHSNSDYNYLKELACHVECTAFSSIINTKENNDMTDEQNIWFMKK